MYCKHCRLRPNDASYKGRCYHCPYFARSAFVAAARGTLQLPKGGSWSVVKKITNGATLPLTNDETVPLIRHGRLQFDSSGNPTTVFAYNFIACIGQSTNVDKYVAGSTAWPIQNMHCFKVLTHKNYYFHVLLLIQMQCIKERFYNQSR